MGFHFLEQLFMLRDTKHFCIIEQIIPIYNALFTAVEQSPGNETIWDTA